MEGVGGMLLGGTGPGKGIGADRGRCWDGLVLGVVGVCLINAMPSELSPE